MADAEAPAPAVEQWPRTVKLTHPVMFDEPITELVFQRGKLGIMKGITLVPGQVPVDVLILIAARLCDQSTKLIEQLDPDDSPEVMSIALNFYARCLAGIAL